MTDPLILGRYRPILTLGEGASGTVELCWDTRIQRRVAIKRLPLATNTPTSKVPGLLEARTAAMLSHPSIVSVIDFETEGDEALLIMEAVEGASLSQLIDDTPPGAFDLDIIASVATSIANALSFAHENQVLHLDIKPDNILITQNGTTKVSDFGISELAGASGFAQAIGGTIGYMPPEQMRGEPLDERCDEFAFAMVVYEMLTGENPYIQKTLNASINAIERQGLPAPSTLRDDVGDELDSVLLCALSPEREERYADIPSFVEALLPYLGDAHTGIARLREVVSFDDEVDEAYEEHPAGPTLAERIAPHVRRHGARLLAGVSCWWAAGIGLAFFEDLGTPLAFACAALVGVAALGKPAFGAVLALGCLAAGLAATLTFPALLTGPVLAALGICWLALAGREALASQSFATEVACTIGPVLLGVFHLSLAAPFLTGLFLSPRRALPAACVTVWTLLALACGTGSASLMWLAPLPIDAQQASTLFTRAVVQPGTWIVVFGWIAATIAMSAARMARTRVSSLLGALLAALVLCAAQVCAQWTATGVWGLPGLEFSIVCALVFVLTAIGCVAVTPPHHKGE